MRYFVISTVPVVCSMLLSIIFNCGSKQASIHYAIDRHLHEMEFGTIAFNAPARINIDDTSQIQLLLSLSKPLKELKEYIKKEGKKTGAVIKVSDKMSAKLTGTRFKILNISPEVQPVSKTIDTEWMWEIRPQRQGRHNLYLSLVAICDINGEKNKLTIKTFEKTIEVYVSPSQKISNFVSENWKWLWTAILVPVAGLVWRRKNRKNRKDSAKPGKR